MTRSYVKVKNSFIGYHRYNDANKHVAFLGDWHRHTFHVHVKAAVEHDDREIEFYDLQQRVKTFVLTHYDLKKNDSTKDFIGDITIRSCEMLAKHIIQFLLGQYGNRPYEVEVWEDLECGGIVSYSPEYRNKSSLLEIIKELDER